MSDCPSDAHVHTGVFVPWIVAHAIVDHSRSAVMFASDRQLADRVAELINRHWLVDVPDTPADLACPTPWPPPIGRPRELARIWRLPTDPTKDHP